MVRLSAVVSIKQGGRGGTQGNPSPAGRGQTFPGTFVLLQRVADMHSGTCHVITRGPDRAGPPTSQEDQLRAVEAGDAEKTQVPAAQVRVVEPK